MSDRHQTSQLTTGKLAINDGIVLLMLRYEPSRSSRKFIDKTKMIYGSREN